MIKRFVLPQMTKKLRYGIFGALFLLILMLVSSFVVPLFMDAEAIRKEAEQELTQTFGHQTSIRTAEVSFFLYPKVVFQGIAMRNSDMASSDKLLNINSAEIDFSLLAFLEGKLEASSVSLDGAYLELEELSEGRYNIHVPAKVHGLLSKRLNFSVVTFTDSRIHYTPFHGSGVYELTGVGGLASLKGSGKLHIDAAFTMNNEHFELHVAGDETSSAAEDMVVNVKAGLFKGTESLNYEGLIGREKSVFLAKGEFSLDTKNLKDWLNLTDIKAREEKLYEALSVTHTVKGGIMVNYRDTLLSFATKDLTFDDQLLAAQGQMAFGERTRFQLNGHLAKLTLQRIDTKGYTTAAVNDLLKKLLPAKADGELNLTIDNLSYGKVKADKLVVNGSLLQGEFVVNQATLNMAGQTQVLLFGIVKPDANNNINMDGNMEIIGNDVQAFFSALNLDEHKLLANHEGAFRAKSNMYLSAKLSNLSEFRFQAGPFLMEGGVQYEPEGKINYTSSLRVRGAKLDSLARYINPTKTGVLIEGDYDTPKITLPWLHALENRYQFSIIFEDFTLYDQPGSRSRFIVDVAPEKMAFRSVDLNVGDIRFTGDISIDQSEKLPSVIADFYLSDFNVSSLFGHNFRKHPVERENVLSIWEDKPLNMDFLKGYNGRFHMKFGAVHHPSFESKDVELNATIEDGEWDITGLTASLWGGELDLKGTLDVSSIASAKMEFRLKNILLQEMLTSTVDIDALRGKMNINGRFDTAGISMNNLIDNMSANIVLLGNDIVVKGFDMAGLIQALPTVRSNSEVANTTRVALMRGQTTFSIVEGAFYIGEGLLKTHGLTLRSKHAIGNLQGSANLINWAMDYAIQFRLPTLAVADVPELTMFFRKSMDDPLLQVGHTGTRIFYDTTKNESLKSLECNIFS